MKSLLFCILFSLIASGQAFSSPRLLDHNFQSGNSCVSNLMELSLESKDYLDKVDYNGDSLHDFSLLYLKTMELTNMYESVNIQNCPQNVRELVNDIIGYLKSSSKWIQKIYDLETRFKNLPESSRNRAMENSSYGLFLDFYVVEYHNSTIAIQHLKNFLNKHPETLPD